jgi:hypothetical protein
MSFIKKRSPGKLKALRLSEVSEAFGALRLDAAFTASDFAILK